MSEEHFTREDYDHIEAVLTHFDSGCDPKPMEKALALLKQFVGLRIPRTAE